MRRIVSQMEVSFGRYLSEVLGLRSAGHYLTSVRTAARYLREKGLIDGELFEVESLSKRVKADMITRNMAATVLHLPPVRCGAILHQLVVEKLAYMYGTRRGAYYTRFPGCYGSLT